MPVAPTASTPRDSTGKINLYTPGSSNYAAQQAANQRAVSSQAPTPAPTPSVSTTQSSSSISNPFYVKPITGTTTTTITPTVLAPTPATTAQVQASKPQGLTASQLIAQTNTVASVAQQVGNEVNINKPQQYTIQQTVDKAPLSYIGLDWFDQPKTIVTDTTTGQTFTKRGSDVSGIAIGFGSNTGFNLDTMEPATIKETEKAQMEVYQDVGFRTGASLIGGGGLATKAIAPTAKTAFGLTYTQLATYAPTGKVAEFFATKVPGGTIINSAYTAIRAKSANIASENVSLIPKAWTSQSNFFGLNLGKKAADVVTPIVGKTGGTIAQNVFGTSLGRGAVLTGVAWATPEVTVGLTTATTSTPKTSLTQAQREAISAQGFETEQIESIYVAEPYEKSYAKPGDPNTMVTEKGVNYTPRTNVPGVDVPFLGRLTPYYIFPTVAVDVFTGGVGTTAFKKGAKQKALEFGLSETQASSEAEYAWTTQGEARSRGELIGIIPGTIAGEETGQALVGGAVKSGLAKAGIVQVGKTFVYASGKKAGESALKEAGSIVLRKSIPGLAVAGASEGATFGYLNAQAQGQQGLQLGSSIVFGAAIGAVSAPVLGAPVARWAITRPTLSKVAMAGLYVADWSEAIGDVGAAKLGKLANVANPFKIKTFTPVSSWTPVNTKTIYSSSSMTNFNITETPDTFNPNRGSTGTLTIVENPTEVPIKDETIIKTINDSSVPVINNSNTTNNIYNYTETPVSTPVFTPVSTPVYTPVSTPTFTPNIPLIPPFMLPGGTATGSGGKGSSRKKYYDELSSAFMAFGESDFLSLPTRRKGRKFKRRKR